MKERFVITFEADHKHAIPVDVRLKRFLKSSLRAYGFKCVYIRTVEYEGPPK